MANQTKELSTVGLIEAKAIELLRLHNPNLSFQGFADTSTATPNHTANYAWIITESGTIFGEASCVNGQVIWSNGSAFVVENILAENSKTITLQKTSSATNALEINSGSLKSGRTINFKAIPVTGGASIAAYLYREDNSYLQIPSATTEYQKYTLTEDFVKIRFYNNTDSLGLTGYMDIIGSFDYANGLSNELNLAKQRLDAVDSPLSYNDYIVSSSLYLNSEYLKSGRTIRFKAIPVTGGASISAFLYREDNSYVQITNATTEFQEHTLTEDFVKIRFYNNTDGLGIDGYLDIISTSSVLAETVDKTDQLEINMNLVSNGFSNSASISGANSISVFSDFLLAGKRIEYKAEPVTTGASVAVFLYREDNSYVQITNATTEYQKYTLTEDFVKIRFYNNTDSLGLTGYLQVAGEIEVLKDNIDNKAMRILIIGDSYSAGAGKWVPPMMSNLSAFSSVLSLAVSSATVRDKFTDRATYPYTSRPVSTDNSGNNNVLACQIEKLKRLMDGTDLDAGEEQIFTSADMYPNVIIIEGGMNDSYDADDSGYVGQFTRQATNVYYQLNDDGAPTLGSCYIKTPIAEVDRTTFAGAYRYLVEELLELFPDAQIFITTASRLGYWSYDVNDRRNKTAAQQRQCAELCGASVIDWNAEGQINTIVNYPQGTGTVGDPYIIDRTVDNVDTNDAMHPNTRGSEKYGRLAALVIKQRFMNIGNS